MIAIILNSGIGKRMGSITTEIPKCMVELAKKETILGRQLKMLSSNGINIIPIDIIYGPYSSLVAII